MSGSSRSPFSPLGTSLANWVAELIPVFLAMLLMSYLVSTIKKQMQKKSTVVTVEKEHMLLSQRQAAWYMLMNLLKLLQLSLHPQPVGFVLELASIMEHLKIFPLDSSPFALLARNEGWTHHAPFRSASSLLGDPSVNKGQVSFLNLWLLDLHLIELSMTCPYKWLISYETLIFNLRLWDGFLKFLHKGQLVSSEGGNVPSELDLPALAVHCFARLVDDQWHWLVR